MASILVKTTEFTGLYYIAKTTYTTPILQAYIDEFEKIQTQQIITGNLILHKLEWNWVLNYKNNSHCMNENMYVNYQIKISS